MDRLSLINNINSLISEEKLSFYLGNQKISNRFDFENNNQYEDDDAITSVSFILYSWIANAIFFKTQGRDISRQGLQLFQKQYSSLKESSKGLKILNSFLLSSEKIMMTELIDDLLPMAIAKAKKNKLIKFKEKNLLKAKHIITNQATLFVRSLYHSFLVSTIDAKKITPDYDDLSNGLFFYDMKTIIIPTWKNAFTLIGYKKVAIENIEKITKALDFDNIDSISVIYLVKDILVNCKLN